MMLLISPRAIEFACRSKACAPPPTGTGGSSGQDNSYRGTHRPNDDGPRAHDLLESEMVPSDVYDRPELYTGYSGRERLETMSQLRAVRGDPDAELTVYRAAPDVSNPIRDGDWVTLSKTYAQTHSRSESRPGNELRIHTMKVRARDVRWSVDDLMEWGYFPS